MTIAWTDGSRDSRGGVTCKVETQIDLIVNSRQWPSPAVLVVVSLCIHNSSEVFRQRTIETEPPLLGHDPAAPLGPTNPRSWWFESRCEASNSLSKHWGKIYHRFYDFTVDESYVSYSVHWVYVKACWKLTEHAPVWYLLRATSATVEIWWIATGLARISFQTFKKERNNPFPRHNHKTASYTIRAGHSKSIKQCNSWSKVPSVSIVHWSHPSFRVALKSRAAVTKLLRVFKFQ